MTYNLLSDISTLTTIPNWQLEKLSDIASKDICRCLAESDGQCVIDIGIGTITLSNLDDCIKYKFVPSKDLENGIIESLNGTDRLISDIEVSANMRMLRVYKDLI